MNSLTMSLFLLYRNTKEAIQYIHINMEWNGFFAKLVYWYYSSENIHNQCTLAICQMADSECISQIL